MNAPQRFKNIKYKFETADPGDDCAPFKYPATFIFYFAFYFIVGKMILKGSSVSFYRKSNPKQPLVRSFHHLKCWRRFDNLQSFYTIVHNFPHRKRRLGKTDALGIFVRNHQQLQHFCSSGKSFVIR